MKIALACSGIGQVQRGFERFFVDLFDSVKGDVDITLFKGGGEARSDEVVVWNTPRHGAIHRWLPLHVLTRKPPYYQECISFGLALWPRLMLGGFDLVHVIDIPTAQVLARLQRVTGARIRTLYSQGVVVDPRWYPRSDHIHQVAEVLHQEGLAHGHAAERMTMIPCGVHAARFERDGRAELRRKYGVPPDQFVVLSVCAVNREQKRVDYLIEEVAAMGDDTLLWVDGQAEDAALPALGARRLGARFRNTQVASADVVELYAMADVFALGSLQESFGLAVVEAMCAGLASVTHDSPHFRWLIPADEGRRDLTRPGELTARLLHLRDQPEARAQLARRQQADARSRYDWSAVAPRFVELYGSLAGNR